MSSFVAGLLSAVFAISMSACGGGGSDPAPNDLAPPVTNAAPVANAGSAQNVTIGTTVTLNGSASSDANGDPLTYAWTFTAKPAGSAAVLTGANSAAPTFTADAAGTYVATLIVSDGKIASAATTVVTATTPTSVSGVISASSFWTKSGSPYILTGDVSIAPGVMLAVQAGVVIEGQNRVMLVEGSLSIVGSFADRAIVNNLTIFTGHHSTVAIEMASINGGIIGVDVPGTQTGTFLLRNSIITNSAGPRIRNPSNLTVSKNIFIGSRPIEVFSGSFVEITSNHFEDWGNNGPTAALILDYGSVPMFTLKHNTFATAGRQAIYLQSLYATAIADASQNYWGTTDESIISSMIFDRSDSALILSTLTFKPYLLTPDPSVPQRP